LLEPFDPDEQAMEADDYTPEELDEYLTAEILLPHGGDNVRALVKEGVKDDQGRHVGLRNSNPMLDTRKYQVQFPDVFNRWWSLFTISRGKEILVDFMYYLLVEDYI
jgi:hypothetical protein